MKRALQGFIKCLSLRPTVTTMEITKTNFRARLPEIEAAIDSSVFVAVDGEFTGLVADRGNSHFDLPHERYENIQESATQFLLVQFGLATFHYDASTDSYSHQAFNVYVWPRPCSRLAPDRRFMCQTSSIDFLSNQNFDFNKLFKEGVPYLYPSEVDRMKANLKERQESRRLSQSLPEGALNIRVPEEQEPFLARIMASVEAFLKSDDQSMELEKCNSFQRRLIYQTAKERFKETCSFTSVQKTGGDRVIMVVKADQEQQAYTAHMKEQAELTDVEEALGFTRVIQKITESGKLVVGHNMLLDIAYTLNQFCGPLPKDYNDFKIMTSSVLPQLLDTKLMANTSPFKQEIFNSGLENMYETLSQPPFHLPNVPPRIPGGGYTEDSAKFHEAGYDAMITGRCFIAMCNRLGHHMGVEGGKKNGRVLPDSPMLKPFINKLFLMKINDIPYMDLAAQDIVPDRSHVFHLRFPKSWRTPDLVHLFHEMGNVFVSWIDDTSAYVALKEKEFADQVLPALQSSPVYTIQTYSSYKLEQKKEAMSVPQTLHSGVTPVMEKAHILGNGNGTEKKRSASPVNTSEVKRHKSVSDEVVNSQGKPSEEKAKTKTFAEPDWE